MTASKSGSDQVPKWRPGALHLSVHLTASVLKEPGFSGGPEKGEEIYRGIDETRLKGDMRRGCEETREDGGNEEKGNQKTDDY